MLDMPVSGYKGSLFADEGDVSALAGPLPEDVWRLYVALTCARSALCISYHQPSALAGSLLACGGGQALTAVKAGRVGYNGAVYFP